jgi:transposase
MEQLEVVSLEELVSAGHNYRKFKELLDFGSINKHLKFLKKENPHEGHGLERLFKCLFLQFLEDLSARELERYLSENAAAKWFCDFKLRERTPDYSLFSTIRKKIGASVLSKIFADLRDQLRRKGYMNEVFTFIDATHLISKGQLWKERDELIRRISPMRRA